MDRDLLRAAMGVIRLHARDVVEADGEAREAFEELDAFLANAKSVPITGEARFNRDHAYERLDRFRRALPSAIARGTPAAAAMAHVDVLAAMVDGAGKTLLFRKLKLDAAKLRHETAAVRVAVTQNLGPPSEELEAALGDLEALVANAPQTGTAALDPVPIFGAVDRLRWAVAGTSK
jgi:hypothetical protein